MHHLATMGDFSYVFVLSCKSRVFVSHFTFRTFRNKKLSRLRGQGKAWGSFDTRLRDVGEVGTPTCSVTLKLALWMLNN